MATFCAIMWPIRQIGVCQNGLAASEQSKHTEPLKKIKKKLYRERLKYYFD